MKNNSGLWAKMQMFVNPTIIRDPTKTAHLMMAPDEENHLVVISILEEQGIEII